MTFTTLLLLWCCAAFLLAPIVGRAIRLSQPAEEAQRSSERMPEEAPQPGLRSVGSTSREPVPESQPPRRRRPGAVAAG